jgi:biotin-dependent carboxylase-like uncharacterized protein
MASVTVVDAGMLATVQGPARAGLEHLGVPAGGAADGLALALGNRLVGNAPGAAAVEAPLRGVRLRFDETAVVAVVGGVDSVEVVSCGGARRAVGADRAFAVGAGEEVVTGGVVRGVVAVVCVRGGVDVPEVLGGRGTLVSAGVGGWKGRALRAGDVLPIGVAKGVASGAWGGGRLSAAAVARLEEVRAGGAVRVVARGDSAAGLTKGTVARVLAAGWRVSGRSDRAGVRLEGVGGEQAVGGGLIASEPMPRGAVQLPPDGRPIVLSVDGPTTGGYPVIGCVIGADWPKVGQLRPGSAVRLVAVTVEEAAVAARRQRAMMAAGVEGEEGGPK